MGYDVLRSLYGEPFSHVEKRVQRPHSLSRPTFSSIRADLDTIIHMLTDLSSRLSSIEQALSPPDFSPVLSRIAELSDRLKSLESKLSSLKLEAPDYSSRFDKIEERLTRLESKLSLSRSCDLDRVVTTLNTIREQLSRLYQHVVDEERESPEPRDIRANDDYPGVDISLPPGFGFQSPGLVGGRPSSSILINTSGSIRTRVRRKKKGGRRGEDK